MSLEQLGWMGFETMEILKGKRDNPLCRPYSQDNPLQANFRQGTQFFLPIMLPLQLFVEDKNPCNVFVIGLALSRSFKISDF